MLDTLKSYVLDESARHCRRTFSRAGWAMSALLLLQILVPVVLVIVLQLISRAIVLTGTLQLAITLLASYGVAFPAAGVLLLLLPEEPLRPVARRVNMRKGVRCWLLCLGWLYICNLITLLAIESLNTTLEQPLSNPSAMADYPLAFSLLLGCVLAPLAEEWLLRYMLLPRLRAWGDGFAIVTSALLFALLHANPYQFLYAFAVGVLLGGIYLHTGKIWHVMAIHAGVNFVSTGLVPLLFRLFGLPNVGDMALTVLMLTAMIYAVIWTVRNVPKLKSAGLLRWGNSVLWARVLVNPGMTVFCLLVIAVVYLNMVVA